ncbi:LPS assembly lipoprotein LptE [Aestuariicoccus sp. MJ-SS9]|uniref:LPS assembly lipoprotein LptE n=1 Tax=Aestuariicoccus sp. MJ-SS9 TaxID=3079855 RepID=UPI00290AF0E7|nr:LPS assembly lipoprotein LptE [Aestuariicoccus sp. MJ-SS9]MDU8912918.1 LPS assembly lipoprotein LptE [Aestuariicoccus sp. MJ-SS9]
MWWSDRRLFLLGGLSALSACGFAPVYGPGGAANALVGHVGLDAPASRNDQLFQQRIEERLGRAEAPRFRLATIIETDTSGLGTTADGRTTRFRILARAQFALRETGSERLITDGRTIAFTGYSASGSTVATLAAERDAYARLMTMLADQVIDQLLVAAPDLPQ